MARRRTPTPVVPGQPRPAPPPLDYLTGLTAVADPDPTPTIPTINVSTQTPNIIPDWGPGSLEESDGAGVPTIQSLHGSIVGAFRNWVSDPLFWSSPTHWKTCTRDDHRSLLALIALKVSTSSDSSAPAALMEALGATAVTRITNVSPYSPNGLRIDVSGATIFVINGCTTAEQVNFLKDRDTDTIYYAGLTKFMSSPKLTDDGPTLSSAARPVFEIGAPWGGFVGLAQAWLDVIKAWHVSADNTGQQVVLIGHSCGAAICELIAAFQSVWTINVRRAWQVCVDMGVAPQLNPYAPMVNDYIAAWGGPNKGLLNVSYGYTFGQPNTFFEGRGITESIRNESAFFGLRILPWRIKCFDHPLDPVSQIPALATWWENNFAWRFTAHRQKPTKFTSAQWLHPNHANPNWYGRNAAQVRMPTNPAAFLERATLYHGINTYLQTRKEALEVTYGPISTTWADLAAWALALPGTNAFNWG